MESIGRIKTALGVAVAALTLGNAVALVAWDGGGGAVAASDVGAGAAVSTTVPPVAAAPPTTAAPAPPPTTAPKPKAKAPAAKSSSEPAESDEEKGLDQFPIMSEGLDYELTLTPTCARPGETFTALLRFKQPYSTATAMAFYRDGSYEAGKGEIARPDGTVTYTWVARPAYGEGRLVTQGMDGQTQEKGTKIVAFRVVEVGQPC